MATSQNLLCSIVKIYFRIPAIYFDTPINVLNRVVKKLLYAQSCDRSYEVTNTKFLCVVRDAGGSEGKTLTYVE